MAVASDFGKTPRRGNSTIILTLTDFASKLQAEPACDADAARCSGVDSRTSTNSKLKNAARARRTTGPCQRKGSMGGFTLVLFLTAAQRRDRSRRRWVRNDSTDSSYKFAGGRITSSHQNRSGFAEITLVGRGTICALWEGICGKNGFGTLRLSCPSTPSASSKPTIFLGTASNGCLEQSE